VPVRSLSAATIRRAFAALDAELARDDVHGELFVVGGAVMCLVFGARDSTRDVDALLEPATRLRQAAVRVAVSEGLPEDWLNDAAKAYLTPTAEFDPFLELPNLRVYTARPAYLLAMKCAAMRLGGEFQDLDDIRFLLRLLDIRDVDTALTTIAAYLDVERLPPKTRLALEELLG
jgi:hypothetical protein